MKFDGQNDVLTIPGSSEFALVEGFTLESWVRPESESDEWAPILAKGIGGGQVGQKLAWWLYEASLESHIPFGGIEPSPGERNTAGAEDPLPVDVWSHVALSYDGARLRLYVDGEIVALSPISTNPPPVSEGTVNIGGAPQLGNFFRGRIDEVRIYSRVLSQLEIQATMHAGLPMAVSELTTEIGANYAILAGTAEARGSETEYFFEYGPTQSYGSSILGEEIGDGREAIEINEAAINLRPETVYHYRLVAENMIGVTYGADKTFETGERELTIQEEEELATAEEEFPETEVGNEPMMKSASGLALAGTNNDPEPDPEPKPGEFFGVTWSGDLARMSKQNRYQSMENAGATYFRVKMSPYADQSEIDKAVKEAKSHNLAVLPYLGDGPFPRPGKEDPEEKKGPRQVWLEYAKKMVEKFGPAPGRAHPITAWEIWNEPNMPFPSKTIEQIENETPEERKEQSRQEAEAKWERRVNPEDFAIFLAQMSREIKKGAGAEAGSLEILAPGLFGYANGDCRSKLHFCHQSPHTFLKRMNNELDNLGASDAYTAFSVHPYVFEIGKIGHKHAPSSESKNDLKLMIEAIKSSITNVHALDRAKPVWVTELGFPVASNSADIPKVSAPEQAKLLKANFEMIRHNSNSKLLSIQHAFYYSIEDTVKPEWEHHTGLFSYDQGPRQAFTAFREVACAGFKC